MTEITAENREEHIARIRESIRKDLKSYSDRMMETLLRAARLLSVSRQVDAEARDDLVRASVVFTHAALEDFLRTMAERFLPETGEDILNDVPLYGSAGAGRAEKFLLGKLTQFRGKSVDEVIRESVSEHLKRSTYNNVNEIAVVLKQMGFDPSEHNAEFAEINVMIQRRHLIVHRADRIGGAIQAVDPDTVFRWILATGRFMSGLLPSVFWKENPDDVLAKKYGFRLKE